MKNINFEKMEIAGLEMKTDTKFLDRDIKDPTEITQYYDGFLEEVKKYSHDQIQDELDWYKRERKMSEEEAMNLILEEIEDRYNGILYQYNQFEDPFKIYRCIKVDNAQEFIKYIEVGKYPKGYEGLGQFWAWDKGSAECYWGVGKEMVTLTVEVRKEDVWWTATIVKNSHLTIGLEEKEISLRKGVKLKILSIETKDFTKDFTKKEVYAVSNIKNPIKIRKRNFMKIRILDPNPSKWFSIKKRGKSYYIVKDNTKDSSKFITLDIGQIKEKGIQGIAFIRGVPKYMELKIGEKVETDDWRSQAIRIEYKTLRLSFRDNPEKHIKKAIERYKETIIRFLEYEYDLVINQLGIFQKESGDYILDIRFGTISFSKLEFFWNSLSIESRRRILKGFYKNGILAKRSLIKYSSEEWKDLPLKIRNIIKEAETGQFTLN